MSKNGISESPKPADARRPKRNLPADERRRSMLDAAVELFAEKGMGITVQALADRVQVTQPLVHRYFPAKADLIAAIRDRIQNAHWDPAWHEILTDRSRPLEDRLPDFYRHYLPHIYRASWRHGFWYAALADPTFAQTYLDHVHGELLVAIITEARHRLDYPSLDEVPPFEREIELVWGLHSTLIFLGIRRYVYHTPVSDDLDTTILDQVQAYLLTVSRVLAELMPRGDSRA